MAVVTKSLIKVLKEGEDSKTKRYSALCVTKDDYDLEELKKLNEIKECGIYITLCNVLSKTNRYMN